MTAHTITRGRKEKFNVNNQLLDSSTFYAYVSASDGGGGDGGGGGGGGSA